MADYLSYFLLPNSMLVKHQIIAYVDGIHGNVFKIKPPLIVTREDCVRILGALDSILKEWEDSR